MATFTNLASRIKSDLVWRKKYRKNLLPSRTVAREVYLVHVSGNIGRASFHELLINPPFEIPTSEKKYGYCSDMTRNAEDLLNLGRCVYLYAGRAHPSFGKIALAFAAGVETNHSGSATAFDTGGLANGSIDANLPNRDPVTLRQFVKECNTNLDDWRRALSRFLTAYFATPNDYWSGKPAQSDPDELLSRNTDWRSRVFEVRFHEGQSILGAAFWCASKGQRQILERKAKALAPVGAIPTTLETFLKTVPSLAPSGTPYYCHELENEIRRRLGL